MKNILKLFATCIVALATVASTEASATTVTLQTTGQGWITQDNFANGNNPGNNYLAGNCGAADCSRGEFRNFFTFSIPTLNALSSATLNLNTAFSILKQDASLTYTVTSTSGVNFGSLGTGTEFGTFTFNKNMPSGTYGITLNSAALAAIWASQGGTFTISGRVTSPVVFGANQPDQLVFGASGGSQQLVLDTTAVPEPASIALLSLGMLGVALARRRQL